MDEFGPGRHELGVPFFGTHSSPAHPGTRHSLSSFPCMALLFFAMDAAIAVFARAAHAVPNRPDSQEAVAQVPAKASCLIHSC